MSTLFTLRQVGGVLLRSGQVLQRSTASKNVEVCSKCYLCRHLSCIGSTAHPCYSEAASIRGSRTLVKQHARLYSEMPRKKPDQNPSQVIMTWKSVLVTCVIGGTLLGGFQYVKRKKELEMEKERTRLVGKAAIGGPFNLIDHTGKPKSSTDFIGQWILVYFGFTHCPDICPDEMEKMVLAVDSVNKGAKEKNKVTPLFITIDPDRDTVELMAAYVKEFSPNMIGLTGSKEQVDEAAKGYRVYHSNGPKDSDGDYIVDHTIIMYLIGPEGGFIDYYGQNKTDDEISRSMLSHIKKWNRMQNL